MSINTRAKSHPSVRYILPSGNPSPTLRLASSEATNRVRSRQLGILRDDQALLATGSVRFEGAFAVPRCLPPALFQLISPTHFLITSAADSQQQSFTLSFSRIPPKDSPVSTRQSNGMTPHPPRPLTCLNCACVQDLEDIFRVLENVSVLWV